MSDPQSQKPRTCQEGKGDARRELSVPYLICLHKSHSFLVKAYRRAGPRSTWGSSFSGGSSGAPGGSGVKNLPAVQESWEREVHSLGWEDPLEEDMATHSSILAWRIPWTEEPGGLQSMGSQRVGHE